MLIKSDKPTSLATQIDAFFADCAIARPRATIAGYVRIGASQFSTQVFLITGKAKDGSNPWPFDRFLIPPNLDVKYEPKQQPDDLSEGEARWALGNGVYMVQLVIKKGDPRKELFYYVNSTGELVQVTESQVVELIGNFPDLPFPAGISAMKPATSQ
jgi:hypothetical protein